MNMLLQHLFLVPKQNEGNRSGMALSCLTMYLKIDHFKMETLSSIMAVMRQNEWTTSTDLKDAYLHIPMALKGNEISMFCG